MNRLRIEVGGNEPLAPDDLELDIRLRGNPEAVVLALAYGFPRESLEAILNAFDEELRRRKE